MDDFSFHKQGSPAWLAKGITLKYQANLPSYTLDTENKNEKSCVSNDSSDNHDDKCFFYDIKKQEPLNIDSRGVECKLIFST